MRLTAEIVAPFLHTCSHDGLPANFFCRIHRSKTFRTCLLVRLVPLLPTCASSRSRVRSHGGSFGILAFSFTICAPLCIGTEKQVQRLLDEHGSILPELLSNGDVRVRAAACNALAALVRRASESQSQTLVSLCCAFVMHRFI